MATRMDRQKQADASRVANEADQALRARALALRNTPRPPGFVPDAALHSAPDWYTNQLKGYVPGGRGTQASSISQEDYLKQELYNLVIPYLDPYTQASTARYLSRANPADPAYANVQQKSGAMTAQQAKEFANPNRLNQITTLLERGMPSLLGDISAPKGASEITKWFQRPTNYHARVDPNAVDMGKPQESTQKAIESTGTALNWLTEALRTAGKGVGPGATRQDQNLARAHLATLYKEAGNKPEVGQFTTLFENIMNPPTNKAPLSGIVGTMRTTGQTPDFQRKGVAFKNPYMT